MPLTPRRYPKHVGVDVAFGAVGVLVTIVIRTAFFGGEPVQKRGRRPPDIDMPMDGDA